MEAGAKCKKCEKRKDDRMYFSFPEFTASLILCPRILAGKVKACADISFAPRRIAEEIGQAVCSFYNPK
jgi:hypothetical protein